MGKRQIVLLALLPLVVAHAAEDQMRLADRMLFKIPELTKPGACVLYREGGAGWILVEPQYWLKGTVLSAAPKKVVLQLCPLVTGKPIEQYSRDEFNRLAKAQPCVAKVENSKEVELGFIRFRVEDWETPWAKTAANAGRLFQGHYLDQKQQKGLELELQADLLIPCP
ncbi:MAG: hypothetical protein BWY57_00965 [Betaproteobacteria bacterium ADurb.Bin341]|nr:MAG: hypothetical protein BWY57_00965 [Betaproteobacteria bacterium ADurb.Bin341]